MVVLPSLPLRRLRLLVEQKNGATVRKLVAMLGLKGRQREGARARTTYQAPLRHLIVLLVRDDVAEEVKQRLQEQLQLLDPVRLLKSIRDAQNAVVAISQN